MHHDMLKGKRIAFVGPAAYVKGKKQGNHIDSFDIIIRVNDPTVIPESEYADLGSRTDILYHNLHTGIFTSDKLEELLNTPLQCIVGLPIDSRQDNFKQVCDGKVTMSVISQYTYEGIKEEIGIDPLTGMVAIGDLLSSELTELYITGFDFYEQDEVYHDNRKPQSTQGYEVHQPQKQLEWFMGITDPRLMLDDYLSQRKYRWLLETQGYCVFKNMYTPEEMDTIRNVALDHFNGGGGIIEGKTTSIEGRKRVTVDAINVNELTLLWKTILKEDLFNAVKNALQTDTLCYVHNSDVQMNRWGADIGWHRDTLNDKYREIYAQTDFWDSEIPYTNYRFALYLQDCQVEGLGLSVQPNTHSNSTVNHTGQYLPTELGDLIMFDARLLHQGMTVNPSNLGYDRLSCFFNFGIPSQTTIEHARGAICRQMEQSGKEITEYEVIPEIQEVLDTYNVNHTIPEAIE